MGNLRVKNAPVEKGAKGSIKSIFKYSDISQSCYVNRAPWNLYWYILHRVGFSLDRAVKVAFRSGFRNTQRMLK